MSHPGGDNSSGLVNFEKLINIEISREAARSMPFRAKTELRADRYPLTTKVDMPLSRHKWTRKSTMRGTVALTGATPLPRHQLQKSIHFACYRWEVDALTQPEISTAYPLGKPDFWRIRWKVATREGSACIRLGGSGRSGVAATASPTKAGREVVMSPGEGRRTTPSPARGRRRESWRDWGSI